MNSALVRALTSGLYWAVKPRVRFFQKALKDPAKAQRITLSRILGACARTEYGGSLDLGSIDVERFRDAVPLADYESLEPWIVRQRSQGGEVLTPGVLKCWEKTSGSRGAEKWIPYNHSHLKTFQSLFLLWCHDLLQDGIELETGRIFFLVSPRPEVRAQAPAGTRVGLRDDSEYLSGWVRWLASAFFVDTSHLHQDQEYLKRLSETLARERDLEVISIWSPSLLLIVLDYLKMDPANLWPKLKLISCWDQGSSEQDAERVRQLFPGVRVQGKGLLATEAAISVPWRGAYIPLVCDYFYEFECEASGRIFNIESLERGGIYRVIVTCPNGFLRYSLGDRVLVDSFVDKTPSLQFLGRKHDVSDMVGEKMQSDFVEGTLRSLALKGFALLVPKDRGYALLSSHSDDLGLIKHLDDLLMEQHHYRLARHMGQLAPLSGYFVPDLRSRYFEWMAQEGKSIGQIKNSGLITDQSRARRLTSELLGSVR